MKNEKKRVCWDWLVVTQSFSDGLLFVRLFGFSWNKDIIRRGCVVSLISDFIMVFRLNSQTKKVQSRKIGKVRHVPKFELRSERSRVASDGIEGESVRLLTQSEISDLVDNNSELKMLCDIASEQANRRAALDLYFEIQLLIENWRSVGGSRFAVDLCDVLQILPQEFDWLSAFAVNS